MQYVAQRLIHWLKFHESSYIFYAFTLSWIFKSGKALLENSTYTHKAICWHLEERKLSPFLYVSKFGMLRWTIKVSFDVSRPHFLDYLTGGFSLHIISCGKPYFKLTLPKTRGAKLNSSVPTHSFCFFIDFTFLFIEKRYVLMLVIFPVANLSHFLSGFKVSNHS